MENNLQQIAYLLDNDNYMVENKIFIDLMWHIAKEKMTSTDAFKLSNCYIIKTDILEKYLSNIVDINKNMYDEKVVKVREKNIKTSTEHKKFTELRTYDVVTPVTVVTNEINVLEGAENDLSTQYTESTENIERNIEVTCSVTPVTVVTSEINVLEGVRNNLSTQSRKNIDKNILITCSVTHVTGVTNEVSLFEDVENKLP